jgi:hypothetical protein
MITTGDYGKALFQFRAAVTEVLDIYNIYGLGVHNEQGNITDVMEKLALQLHARIQGVDIPIGQQFELVSIVGEEPDD